MPLAQFLLLLAIAAVVYVVVSSFVRSVFNPILPVDDEIAVDRGPELVGPDVAALLGTARRIEFLMPGPGTYQLAYRTYPGWSIVLGIVLFPIGLLFVYFARERLVLTVTVVPRDSGSSVRVFGRAHKKLAESIGQALELQLGARK